MNHPTSNLVEDVLLINPDLASCLKRGCMRESTILEHNVTLTSLIWLKIAMVAGNDLKLSHAKYFWTFISEKIA